MNKPEPVPSAESGAAPVFISYATANRKEALAVCKAVERRGTSCWISSRDVKPGENYQEAIVRTIRNSRAMVLVFSDAANNSDEIKKELSLASKHRIPLMALRIEDVEPSDAFAYELSTRQWIDAFENWDKSVDALVDSLDRIAGAARTLDETRRASRRRPRLTSRSRVWGFAAIVAILILLALAGQWRWIGHRSASAPTIGFAGFTAIGSVVAPASAQSLDQEVRAALGTGGIPLSERGADLVLRGSIEQQPDGAKLTATVEDSRHSESLWTRSDKLDESNGLTAHVYSVVLAATMACVVDRLARDRRPENAVLSMFIQACYLDNTNSLDGELLDVGRAMTRSAPDFTGGWWAIAAGAVPAATLVRLSGGRDSSKLDDAAREEGAAAARRLIQLAPDDAEGYRLLAALLPLTEAVEKDRLFRVSISKRPESCGCGYAEYGDFLIQSGRFGDGLAILQRGLDQSGEAALSQWRVAMAQYLIGDRSAAAGTMDRLPTFIGGPAVAERKRPLVAMWDGRWKDAVAHVKVMNSDDQKAIDEALAALASGNAQRIDSAGRQLQDIPVRLETEFEIIPLLAALGRADAVFKALDLSVSRHGFYSAPGTVPGFSNPLLFDPRLRAISRDPRFPAYLQKAGFLAYWKTTRSKPDICSDKKPPPFCAMI